MITPSIKADDILAASTKVSSEVAPEGTYEMEIASPRDHDGTAYITLKTSERSGNQYLSVGLRFAEKYKNSAFVWANAVMLTGESAAYSKNIAGFLAALGIKDVPSIAETGTKDKNGNPFVTFAVNGDTLNLAKRTLKVKLGVEPDQKGEPRNKVVDFIAQ